jgi:raffinose/stachyose/melibiose transport system permease protein
MRTFRRALLYLLAWTVALAILIPLIYAVLGGFRDTGQIAQNPVALPDPWVFSNYTDVLKSDGFWKQVANSVLIAFASTLFTVPLAAAAAFVFARFAFPGREVFYTIFTLGLLFPVAVAILPIFIMVRNLGLLDNPLGVALPQAAFGLPLTIVILRPFFASFPNELQDAAAIDGCGAVPVLLADPAAAVAARAGHGVGARDRHSWNAFLLPLSC